MLVVFSAARKSAWNRIPENPSPMEWWKINDNVKDDASFGFSDTMSLQNGTSPKWVLNGMLCSSCSTLSSSSSRSPSISLNLAWEALARLLKFTHSSRFKDGRRAKEGDAESSAMMTQERIGCRVRTAVRAEKIWGLSVEWAGGCCTYSSWG